jgi:hypothetical protein
MILENTTVATKVNNRHWYWHFDSSLDKDFSWNRLRNRYNNISLEACNMFNDVIGQLSRVVEIYPEHAYGKYEYLFINFKSVGSVSVNGNSGCREIRRVNNGCWLDIEFDNRDINKTMLLIKHKLAHAVLIGNYPAMSEDKQHELISMAGL